MRHSGVTLLTILSLSGEAAGQQFPNYEYSAFSPAQMYSTSGEGLAYTVTEMVDAIRPIIGHQAADQLLQDAATVVIEELSFPAGAEGVASQDGFGVMINTMTRGGYDDPGTPGHDNPLEIRQTPLDAGMTLYHEMQHVRNTRNANSSHGDPTTQGPCGACNHSAMHSVDAAKVAAEGGSPEHCNQVELQLASAGAHMESCSPACGDAANDAAIALDTASQAYADTCR